MSYQSEQNVQPLALPRAGGETVEFTLTDENSNARTVVAQLKRFGRDVAERRLVRVYVSSDADGDGVAATPPSGAVALTTGGGAAGTIIATHTAKVLFDILTDDEGKFNLSITESGTKSYYLVVVGVNGELNVTEVEFA